MPTIISHPVVPLTLAALVGSRWWNWRLLALGVLASMLPDLDVLAFRWGIAYSHEFGHRGFSHSLAFALILGAIGALIAPILNASRWVCALFLFASCASHGLLDMCTNGGLGVAYFWPLSETRYFFPHRFIEVSPLNLNRFMGPAGLSVLHSEWRSIWLPAIVLVITCHVLRKLFSRRASP